MTPQPSRTETPDGTALVVETAVDPSLAPTIADVAAATFPLACPPHSTPENIAAHIEQVLSAERFSEYLTDPVKQVLIARLGPSGPIIGYALLVHDIPTDPDVFAAVDAAAAGSEAIANRTVTEISKMYVLPAHHAANNELRPSHALMSAAVDAARSRGATLIWLGVHSGNERAKKYYTKMGFRQIGTKTFDMNGAIEHDFVLARGC
ncbi:GNAT family N-acetyltransferase [Gordonia neofelifaecis]|uniref:GCN5-like N-acetyltransferase n=1 Tax=Gordonia neofelifaecis NRRL B-59395 TaxID=644548 RepID=F1YML2_9ACTN|nr:GNAT family N-acetyltransferase [Gordonia neofelifaecis]EGD53947.1 GCN5-like N-acetyltransferase [Gordonia neofelifaecis NRRL B-59395]